MADVLYDLLDLDHGDGEGLPASLATLSYSAEFLNRLTSLSLESLSSTEPASLSHDADSVSKTIQALSKRSYKPIDTAVQSLLPLRIALSELASNAALLAVALPAVERKTLGFAQKYDKNLDNSILARRGKATLLSENMERLTDILELPNLLASTISTSFAASQSSTTHAGYASALDLYAHIKRLQRLYPTSSLIKAINIQADSAIREMTANIILTLRSQSMKLAGGMRLISLLRRVAPDLDDAQNESGGWASGTSEGSLGALFLVSRLVNLNVTLDALEPLKELADQEATQYDKAGDARSKGQQTERYLKRYIENFREQCFAIVSMYKSIFPSSLQGPLTIASKEDIAFNFATPLGRPQYGVAESVEDPLQNLPPTIASFTLEIVDSLMETLKRYLPNVHERSSRDSLLTQVLYCASSLGRLGGDFTVLLSGLEHEQDNEALNQEEDVILASDAGDPEWAQLIQKHRIQASRLELLANGVGSPKTTSMSFASKEIHSVS